MVVGSPALNQNAFAVLAFGGLTRNDVKLVEFSSYGAMWKGILKQRGGRRHRLHHLGSGEGGGSLTRGLVYPPTPAADKAG